MAWRQMYVMTSTILIASEITSWFDVEVMPWCQKYIKTFKWTSLRQKYVMTSTVSYDVIMSKIMSWCNKLRHDINSKSWRQRCVMTSIVTSWRQQICHDVENDTMTSNKVRHGISIGLNAPQPWPYTTHFQRDVVLEVKDVVLEVYHTHHTFKYMLCWR